MSSVVHTSTLITEVKIPNTWPKEMLTLLKPHRVRYSLPIWLAILSASPISLSLWEIHHFPCNVHGNKEKIQRVFKLNIPFEKPLYVQVKGLGKR